MVLSPAAPVALPALEDAYEQCRRETERWAKTFYLGTLLMPPEKRRAIWAIYVWCRRTDELMDSPEAQALPVGNWQKDWTIGRSAPGLCLLARCAMGWIG